MLDNSHDLLSRLNAARANAHHGGVPARRKDSALYAMLAECLGICEVVEREGLHGELRAAVSVSVNIRGAGNAGKGRRYAETKSDAFILVARYVLESVDSRNSVYRYASILREAKKRQIASDTLVEWLIGNGGCLALKVPIKPQTTMTRTLHLTASVAVPTDRPFTLTVKRLSNGFFEVMK